MWLPVGSRPAPRAAEDAGRAAGAALEGSDENVAARPPRGRDPPLVACGTTGAIPTGMDRVKGRGRRAPTVGEYMSRNVKTISRHDTLADARALMREHQIRHLVVVEEDGALAGVVSERDLSVLECYRDVDPSVVCVEEAMALAPYRVAPSAPLAEVAATMAEWRYGSAVVMEDGKLAGVFTTTDALRALATLGAKRPVERRHSAMTVQ
jgi:acetoin utilization protein AcuB